MDIGWAAVALAQQVAIHIADAGAAIGGPSVDAYKEGPGHEWLRNTDARLLTRCQEQAKGGQSKSADRSIKGMLKAIEAAVGRWGDNPCFFKMRLDCRVFIQP